MAIPQAGFFSKMTLPGQKISNYQLLNHVVNAPLLNLRIKIYNDSSDLIIY